MLSSPLTITIRLLLLLISQLFLFQMTGFTVRVQMKLALKYLLRECWFAARNLSIDMREQAKSTTSFFGPIKTDNNQILSRGMQKEPNKSTIIGVTDKQQRETDLVQVHFFNGTYLLFGWSDNSMRSLGLAKDIWCPTNHPGIPFVVSLLNFAFTRKWFRDIIMLLNTPIRNASTGLTLRREFHQKQNRI